MSEICLICDTLLQDPRILFLFNGGGSDTPELKFDLICPAVLLEWRIAFTLFSLFLQFWFEEKKNRFIYQILETGFKLIQFCQRLVITSGVILFKQDIWFGMTFLYQKCKEKNKC